MAHLRTSFLHQQATVHGNVKLKWIKPFIKLNRRFTFCPAEKSLVTDGRK